MRRMSKRRENSFFPLWVRGRKLRQPLPLGHSETFYKSLYSSISRCHPWVGGETSRSEHGILHNLEFSPDGTLLVAGCRNNSFLMLDPLSRRLIRKVCNAHASCVSHVKFLDNRIFATGCLDGTVSLWDSRNLKSRCETLEGHSNVVENIEFSRKNDLLITSGLDGVTCIWDIKSWNRRGEFKKETLTSHSIIRLRLNPDETKMIFSTVIDCLMIVHDLDLNTIAQDLNEFTVDMLETSYSFEAITTAGSDSKRILTPNSRRNRMEIVADFPNTGDSNAISALEIHPQGWSMFSRCTSDAPDRDWTCVHDIQEKEPSEGGEGPQGGSKDKSPLCPQRSERINEECCWGALGGRRSSAGIIARARSPSPGPSSAPPYPRKPSGLGSNPTSSWVQDPSIPLPNPSVEPFNRFPRLTHYIEDSLVRDWHLQSLCVSPDGRLVCSPVEHRIRLLAFSPECSEQSVSCREMYPRRLHELSTCMLQSGVVLCAKFSPRDRLLVSVCSRGQLAWYQPVV